MILNFQPEPQKIHSLTLNFQPEPLISVEHYYKQIYIYPKKNMDHIGTLTRNFPLNFAKI